MKKIIWALWFIVTAAIASYYGYTLLYAADKTELLIGDASHGHFQIEMACEACHAEPFGGEEILQDACLNCHAEELQQAHDSHPQKKFNDPRNAATLEIIDARYCISCHSEHKKEQTLDMGLTLPEDYCYHCHKDVGDNRPSHKDLAFDSCASAGCHNYHDNRALYEKFLVENSGQPWLQEIAKIAQASAAGINHQPQSINDDFDIAKHLQRHPKETKHWQDSVHMRAGVVCSNCHNADSVEEPEWIVSPALEQCQGCHENESEGFKNGKHGMRLAQHLAPITPADSDLRFQAHAAHQQQSCTSCHSAHEFDTAYAATEACLGCHSDEHSLAFKASKHGQLVGNVDADEIVSCATCHMPRLEKTVQGKKVMMVEHNQNAILRPNEKMIRPVCMQCHSLEFSIDALADELLIKSNFNGKPTAHIPSVDWAVDRNKD